MNQANYRTTTFELNELLAEFTVRAQAIVQRHQTDQQPAYCIPGLTPREHELFPMLLEPIILRQIAVKMKITTRTVKMHATGIYRKFGVPTRMHLVRKVQMLRGESIIVQI